MATIMQLKKFASKRSACLLGQGTPVQAASKKKAKEKVVDNDGLDSSVRELVNQGLWSDAVGKLEQLVASDQTPGRNEAWLAFGYLYTGKANELKALDKKVETMPVNDKDPNAKILVEVFAMTIQGKFDDADKLFGSLKDENADPLAEFARACVALKKGNAKQAAEYCEKVVGLCPNFAWGYRTLGFIQDKSLKNPDLAKTAYQRALAAEPSFKDVRSLLVDVLLSKNDFDGAIAVAKEAIELYPKDAGNYYRLSQIYQQQWRLIEALAELQKAVRLAQDDPRFYRAMASIYRYQDKMNDAISEQQKAVELSKDKAFELIELASLQDQDQKFIAAIDSLKAAVKDSPSNAIAQQKLVALLKKENRNDELIAEFNREIELEPKAEPLRLAIADAYKQAGKIDEAVEQLKVAANLEQTDPRPHREIAKIELARKNYQAAAKSYTRALNISLGSHAADAGSVEDLVALGFCYANNDDYSQAETAFTTAFAMLQLGTSTGLQSPVNPSDILRSLSSVFFTEGRYREAVMNLETGVIPYDKDNDQKKLDQLMCAEAKALRDHGGDSLKDLQASFAALDHSAQLNHLLPYIDTFAKLGKKELLLECIKKFSDNELKEQCPLALASAYLAEDKAKDAREIISKVIEDKKSDQEIMAVAYLELAQSDIKDGDHKAAKEALQKAISSNGKDFNALVELSRLYLSDKQTTEAQQAAQRALDVNLYCVPAHICLADAYLQANKLKEAEASFAKAAELNPSSIEAHKGLLSVYQKQSKASDAAREQEIISNLSKNS
jgi:tetratricopeptide (TPR) repeat protein